MDLRSQPSKPNAVKNEVYEKRKKKKQNMKTLFEFLHFLVISDC